ncbi:MAG: hypothetical protein ACAI35_06845 [Candidatus Methylacidiphilales bacterium]|nr:hypothetical protein [Candidatus Methylacidiphilales bacterium]
MQITTPFASAWSGVSAAAIAALTFPGDKRYPSHPIVSALVAKINNRDCQAFTDLFSKKAVVHDEGRTMQGKPEILKWMQGAIEEYDFKIESYTLGEEKSETRKGVQFTEVTFIAKVTGNFDGSPADLLHVVIAENRKVTLLKISFA